MKNKLFLILILLFSTLFIFAQENNEDTVLNNEVTILYLLPFHTNEHFENLSTIKTSAEIHQIQQFEMMGFWMGAKMALQEYENSKYKIHVIVRDAVTDTNRLHYILKDSVLMSLVNIIIGPFYGSLFPTAAEYAKTHNITIVNPFSTRFDFVENNPSVYKLTPPFLSRPETVDNHFLLQSENYNIILWGDSATTPELLAYRYYLTENIIPYKEVHTLTVSLSRTKPNLIVALFDNPERVIHAVHTLMNTEEQPEFTLIVPEKWLNIYELPQDFYHLQQLYFFTHYFVDEKNELVKQFQNDYTFYYEAPADLASFSYQGYDITKYFIELFFEDFIHENVLIHTFSYQFTWNKIENGGFENIKTRFIQVKDLELIEVIY